MRRLMTLFLGITILATIGCYTVRTRYLAPPPDNSLPPAVLRPDHEQEVHLQNVRQLTFGGQNAEAYLSPDDQRLIFQSTRPPHDCDQIFTMNLDGSQVTLISSGLGRTTCSYFDYQTPGRIVYSSTHLGGDGCPPTPDRSSGYVWPIYDSYEIFAANLDGSGIENLTNHPGYDAEATFRADGGRIVFTSHREGDMDIYSMNPDGSDVQRLTSTPGYDGGPFFSRDGSKIVFRGHHPTGEALEEYRALLKQGLVRPSIMELFVMDADGSNMKQLTNNGKANFCPFFHPDGERIIFASNMDDPRGREFDLYMIRVDGTGLERITYTEDFDGFPMFTGDGKTLVWCSNRFNGVPRETNVFVADWVD